MVAYEALLPAVDLSALAARYPALLLEHTPATVSAQLARLRCPPPPPPPSEPFALLPWENCGDCLTRARQ